jgi:hypothetical protein
MNGLISRWMDGRCKLGGWDGWMGGGISRWMDGWIGRLVRWLDGWKVVSQDRWLLGW